jgi:general secretion pathway protein D
MELNARKIITLALVFVTGMLWAEESTSAKVPAEAMLDRVDAAWTAGVAENKPAESSLVRDGTQDARTELRARQVASLEAVKTPLSGVLDLINEAMTSSGGTTLNFVFLGNIDPEVSLNLKNVNAEQALNLALEGTGLTYELKDGAVVIHPTTTLPSVETHYYPMSQSLLNRIIGTPEKDSSDTKKPTSFDKIRAESDLRAFFEQMGVAFGDGTGLALADGELIVSQSAKAQERIAELLGRFSKQRQVEIEAKFMEVSEGALEELGVQWNVSNSSGSVNVGTSGVTSDSSNTLRTLADTFTTAATTTSVTSTTGSTTTTISTSAPTIPGTINLGESTSNLADVTKTIGDYSINGILRALSQKDGTETLSAPRVTVLSGATATLTVAQEMRYPQSYDRVNTDVGSSSSTSSSGSIITAPTPLDFTTRNVGVEMKVTPIVEADGSITLNLEPEVTQFERFVDYGGQSVIVSEYTTETVPSGFYQPIFNVRKVSTQVNIPNQGTVLMGGLTREETVKVKDKVPLLGDIPFLGKAFRHEGTSTQKKNLVIFVTARLVQ